MFLIIKKGVILGKPETTLTIQLLDKFFEKENYVAYVTSILRDPKSQLRIIIDYAKKYNLPVSFTPNDVDTVVDGLYVWQKTWSLLLNKGVIISPPRPAICLYDYIRNGVNRKGQLINTSPHFSGLAFDVSASSLNKITSIIENAKTYDSKLQKLIKGWLIEHMNNCVHVDVNPV